MTNEERHIAVLNRMLENMDVYDSIQPTTERKKAIKAAIKALEQQPCDDAISRQAIMRLIENKPYDWSNLTERHNMLMEIRKLPPVTPQQKYGKWIKVKSGDKDFPESIVCSRCSNENSHLDFNENAEPIGKVFVTSKFCPYCGAKMQESEEIGEIHCNHTETEIAKSFIEDVEAVKELLPKAGK